MNSVHARPETSSNSTAAGVQVTNTHRREPECVVGDREHRQNLPVDDHCLDGFGLECHPDEG